MKDFFNEHKKLIIIGAVAILILLLLLIAVLVIIFGGDRTNGEEESDQARYLRKYVDYHPRLTIERRHLDKYIEELSSDAFLGRLAGTKGEAEAALYLARELKAMGYEPFWQDNYFQKFPVPQMVPVQMERRYHLRPSPSGISLTADNVAGYLLKEDAEEFIIISAHYDHLGMLNGDQPRIFGGANRNASGVAAVLEMARVISENALDFDYNIIIAFWSGHEAGLLGSDFFAEQVSSALLRDVKLHINLDTIGSFGSQNYIIWKENYRPNFFINEALQWERLSVVEDNGREHTSDHYHLGIRNVPAVTILSENWMQGTASLNDTRFGVNSEGVRILTQHLINYLYWLEGE